jgi:hypothetical protein
MKAESQSLLIPRTILFKLLERDHKSEMVSKSNQPQISLFRGWKEPGNYVWSPFVTKIELRLRLAGLQYVTDAGSVASAPKGKIPYIEISENDRVGDSTLIIKHLIEKDYVEDINSKLSPQTNAYDMAIRALLEDKLYFYHVLALTSVKRMSANLFTDSREMDTKFSYHEVICIVCSIISNASYHWIFHL